MRKLIFNVCVCVHFIEFTELNLAILFPLSWQDFEGSCYMYEEGL